MNDRLLDILSNQAMQQGVMAPPPNPDPKLPSADQRWKTAEQMKEAYRQNWTPNPHLVRHAGDL